MEHQKNENLELAINQLVAHILGMFQAENISATIRIDTGKRYVKLVRVDAGGASGSVWCFIDTNGDILKPAGWAKPAKHSRGSVFDPNTWKAFRWTGPQYLK